MWIISTHQTPTYVCATHPDYSWDMPLFTSSTYLFYLPKMIMMMNHLFLQTSNPVASTVVTRYASAYGTTRDEIGPVKLQIINCDLFVLRHVYIIFDMTPPFRACRRGRRVTTAWLSAVLYDATLKNMKERKQGDDSMAISCFVHSRVSLYLYLNVLNEIT